MFDHGTNHCLSLLVCHSLQAATKHVRKTLDICLVSFQLHAHTINSVLLLILIHCKQYYLSSTYWMIICIKRIVKLIQQNLLLWTKKSQEGYNKIFVWFFFLQWPRWWIFQLSIPVNSKRKSALQKCSACWFVDKIQWYCMLLKSFWVWWNKR